jgi:hypothetical protein
MPSTQYYIYGPRIDRNAFRVKVQLIGVEPNGELVFEDDSSNEYRATAEEFSSISSEGLLVEKGKMDSNNTPIFDHGKQLADEISQNDFDSTTVEKIKEVARELFKLSVRNLN